MTVTKSRTKRPALRRLALLLPCAMLAACSSGEGKGGSQTSAGDVAKAAWSPANLTEVQGVPIAALRTAVTARLAGQRPATVGAEAWQHTQRLYKRFGETPLWLTKDGLEKERAGALTNAVLNANADALKLDEYPISELANALVALRRSPQPTAEQLADADVLLTATYASLGEDLLTGYVDPKYVQDLRAAAIGAWAAAAPDDSKLAELLRTMTSDRNRTIREDAVKRLAALHHEADLTLLRELEADPDPSIAYFAKSGVEETEGFLKK